jgi:hypothetical protein
MYGEDGLTPETAEVCEAIRRADVLVVGFRAFPERLLLDSRQAGAVGSLVQVVEPLAGVEERMFWLGQQRPQFGMPQRFTFFAWPNSVGSLGAGTVGRTLAEAAGPDGGEAQLQRSLAELRRLERVATRAAIVGDQWRTLWDAHGTTRPGR